MTARFRQSVSQAMRLGLPLGAVVLMSTIFLVSVTVDPNRAVVLSGLDPAEITREPRIGGARFAAVGESGTALNIVAVTLRSGIDPQQGGPLDLILDAPRGEVTFATGGSATFQAEHGRLDQISDTVVLTGAVELQTSTGYRMTLTSLQSDLGGEEVTGTGPVAGVGPAGQIAAQSVTLRATTPESGAYVLAFVGDVRLLYIPTGQGAE